MKRANLMVGVGALLVVLGVALVWIIGRGTESKAAEATVPVLVARTDLETGQSGDDVVASGGVSIDRVVQSKVRPGALSATTAMAGTIVNAPVAKGEQVVTSAVRPANLRTAAVTIPKGKQAVAVTVEFTNGAAGYAGTGDHVNVYSSISDGKVGTHQGPYTRLLLSNVEVLDVSNEVAPHRAETATSASTGQTATAAREGTGQLTILLALDAQQAEQAIFASSFDRLWFTVLPKGQGASKTVGVTHDDNYVDGK